MDYRTFLTDTTRSDNPLSSNTDGDTNEGNQGKLADFLTVQSLPYSVAITAIGLVWALVKRWVGSGWVQGPIVPIVLASLLMLASYAFAWDDLKDRSKRLGGFIIAAFNAALLVAGAFGITTALS
jgi:hypothetical protein